MLGLENASRGRDLREVAGQRLAARLQGRFKLEPAVAERAVVFGGGRAAFVERQVCAPAGRAVQQRIRYTRAFFITCRFWSKEPEGS